MDKESVYFKFVLSIVRKAVTAVATLLVGWGYVDADLANEFSTSAAVKITLGIIAAAISFWASYKNVILETLKTRVAIALPPTTSIEKVAAIANTVHNKKAVASGEVDLTEKLEVKK
jgi:hypothetical protein